jgi:quercetin dioxygenase-like cupin family protein
MALHHLHAGEKVRLPSPRSSDAKTSAFVKTDRFEAVQLVLHARDEIAPHSVPGYATLLCLEGAVTLRCPEDIYLETREWLYLDRGQRHSVTAIEDSLLLMTILFD